MGPSREKQSGSPRSLRRRWRRAFAAMLVLSLSTAALSIGLVHGLVADFSRTARESDEETALLGELVPTLLALHVAAHSAIDSGAVPARTFLALDADVATLLDRADATFDQDPQRRLAGEVRARWVEMYETLRPIAADPVRIANLEAELGDDDAIHMVLGGRQAELADVLDQLTAAVHAEARNALTEAEDTRRRLVGGLGTLFVVSAFVTLRFQRSMRRDVLEPLDALAAVAHRFGEGDYETRAGFDRDDELGALARRFDAMAASLSANHRSLTQQAYHDSLTGLANRPAFVRRLEEAAASEERGVLFVDLDDFKVVNDTLGHEAGDELLGEVAERLGRAIRPTDLLSRLGGDEFAVLLTGPTGAEGACRLAERMLEELVSPFVLAGRPVRVSASIGVALGRPEEGSAALLRRADVAMYAAKGRGKNRVELFDDGAHGLLPESGRLAATGTAR